MPCGRRCELILCVSCVAGTLRGYGALFGQPAAYVKTLRAMTTVARSGERGGPWAKPACKNHMDFKRHRNRPDSLSGSALIRSRTPRVSHCEYCILKARRVAGSVVFDAINCRVAWYRGSDPCSSRQPDHCADTDCKTSAQSTEVESTA